ncbi:hypothetical protein KP79_PYT06905 [Mizuhopecten yessoensis]|uniref:Uncharacterized protein n=1 Tax=Mizuhopecten yessoensis TaxID=6573 RepID=A0A210Q7L6_MIZYE|nr:hypothetical protein KP79_PYT06905 [Mizuhopecten yessoensis]
MTYMRRSAISGIWTGNELFAMKKNVAEDIKLKKTVNCLSMDQSYEKHAAERDIRGTRVFLKDVRLSTGHSKEGVASIESFPSCNHLPILPYDVPDRLLQRSEKSFSLRPRGSVIYEINQAISEDTMTSIFRETTVPAVQATRIHRPRVLTATGVHSEAPTEHITRRTKSDGISPKYLSVNERPRENTKLSYFTDDINDDFETESVDEEEKRMQEFQRLNTRYNPWNIQQRNGVLYDALELPRIRDCYRPVCRLSCNTCMSRKQNAPCFVIPGITHPAGFVLPLKSVPNRVKRQKKKKKSKIINTTKSIESTRSVLTRTIRDITQDGHYPCDVTEHDEIDDKFQLRVQQELKFLLKTDKKINKDRLKELSTPREGFKKDVRFSKMLIKKEVKSLTLKNAAEVASANETENKRKIDSRVNMFLAMLNSQGNHIPTTMVHIPLREDIMQVDISHIQTVDLDMLKHHNINTRRV